MFIRAVQGKGRSVIYFSSDGKRLIRSGGSPAWRNNNPGNLRKGTRWKEWGSIGLVGGFCVFPDYATGRNANRSLLKSTYLNFTLYRLPTRYAPRKHKNRVERYRRRLHEFSGFDLKRVIRTLTAKEIEILLDAIQRIEGYEVGKEAALGPAKKIIDVKRDRKGRIVAYFVEDSGWLSPVDTVKGILSGDIDGVVAHRGERCLRADETGWSG
ncbi:MAG: hypothetical protein HY537_19005 [Deltaproteobacteria bacterium]|nr:hypothetical protein [Deltaproteobacteria bacterium]